MSAVMSTLSMISGGRRAHRKLTSSRKSGQFSDAGDDRSRSQHDLNKQRSASLQTLEAGGAINLDNLEAKMASIEVSLSGPRRRSAGPRDGCRELDALRAALADKDTLILSLKKQLNASLSAARLAAQASSPTPGSGREDAPALSTEERLALEERAASVRDELETRRANIQELKRRLEKTHVTENIDSRIEQAELQYQVGREELELLTLGEQARALALLMEQADAARARRTTLYNIDLIAKSHIKCITPKDYWEISLTNNIDLIAKSHIKCITPKDYWEISLTNNAVRECGGGALLVAAEARDGAWSAALRGAAVSVDWTEHPAMEHGDRVLEINGTSTLWCGADELRRAVAAAAPARLVLLRAQPQNAEVCSLRAAAARAGRAERELRGDNTRLTHRISYLEDQVAEMLTRHPQLQPVNGNDGCITVNKTKKNVTNINITSEPPSKTSPKSEIQVFQKGPDITAIVAKLPGLDESEASALPVVRPRSALSAHARDHRNGRTMRHSLSHHCIHDYGAETDAAIRMIERNRRHMDEQKIKTEKYNRSKDDRFGSEDDPDAEGSRTDGCDSGRKSTKKATERIEESIKKTNWAERKTLSIIEQLKRSQRLRKMKKNESAENSQVESERQHVYGRIDGKVLENAHKSSRRSSKLHSRSAKSSEFESECSDYPNGEARGGSHGGHYVKREEPREERCRPAPPRKPLRLSLHRARSAHSLVAGSESEASRPPSEAGPLCKRPVKRTHAAERPRDPRATPRPARRAPPADGLYPDAWC